VQAGLRIPESGTEIVLTTRQDYEPDRKAASANAAAEVFAVSGGRVLADQAFDDFLAALTPPTTRGSRVVLAESAADTPAT
jgi:hypothetical protein